MTEDRNYDEVLLATVLQLSIANATDTAARAANEYPDVDPALLVSWEALCWGLRKLLVACNEVDQSWKFRDQGLAQTLIEEGFDWLASQLPVDTLSFLSPRVRGHEFDYPETFDTTFWPAWLTHRLACRASQEGTPLNDLDLEVLGDWEGREALPGHLAELMHRAHEDDSNGTGMSSDPRWWELAAAGGAIHEDTVAKVALAGAPRPSGAEDLTPEQNAIARASAEGITELLVNMAYAGARAGESVDAAIDTTLAMAEREYGLYVDDDSRQIFIELVEARLVEEH